MTQTTTLSREKLADAILSSALDCIIVADETGRIVEFNAAAERTFGWARADILGKLMEETIVPHHHRHAHHHGMNRYLTGGAARVVGRRVEVEGLNAAGKVFPVELSITETWMGEHRFFVANLRDISTQKAAEDELAKARASLQAIFDNIPAALYLRDRQDNLVMINNWGAHFLGREPAEMIGQPMAKFREPQNQAGVKEADDNIARTGKPETHEFTYHLPGGDRVGLMTFFPVTDGKGEVTQIGGMLIDVTELHTARRQMQQAQAALQSFVEQMPVGIHINRLGPGGITDQTVEFLNENICKPYGLQMDKVIGRDPYAVFRNEEVVRIQKDLDRKILKTRRLAVVEMLNPYTKRHERYTRFPILGPDGTVTHIGGTHVDVDDTVRAKAQLSEAQALLQSIFDNVPAVLYLRELDGRFITVNKWGAAMMGVDAAAPEPEITAQSLDSGPERETATRAQEQLLATGQPVTQEYRRIVDGREMVVLNSIFPVRDATGQIVRIGGFATDVTELYKARNELQAAQDLLQTIFDNVPAELYLRRLDGHYIMANNWALEFYGVSAEDLPNLTAETFDTGDSVEVSRQAQRELLATGQPVTREYQHKARGRDVVIMNTIFPLRNAAGEIDRIGGVSTDITELYNARNQLRQAEESLHQSEKLAALGQLLAGIAHELNNPLAVVLGRAAILQEKLSGTPHETPLQKLREAANRCARIVKTFLAMARQTGPRRQMVDVNDLVEAALEMTTYGLRTADITWNSRLPGQGYQIEADQDQIVQVLINLILNAQHALEGRDGPRRIDISATLAAHGPWVEIAVADNGPGVPDSIASRIFDPFFTTKAVGQGTGLGLSVCKSMVEAHGGTLVLGQTPGGGATFRITLPSVLMQSSDTLAATDDTQNPRLRGRFLIVDDEVELAAILADCLTPLGIDCVIATDGHAALARVAETRFDAVFCDVSMPGMDGITFYHRLKDTNPILAAHLIFISGDVLHRNWDRFKSTVDRPILEKPFDPEQIREAALSLIAPEGGH